MPQQHKTSPFSFINPPVLNLRHFYNVHFSRVAVDTHVGKRTAGIGAYISIYSAVFFYEKHRER